MSFPNASYPWLVENSGMWLDFIRNFKQKSSDQITLDCTVFFEYFEEKVLVVNGSLYYENNLYPTDIIRNNIEDLFNPFNWYSVDLQTIIILNGLDQSK